MAELFGTMLRMIVFILALGSVSAKRFSIMAPNILHIGVEETVSVTVFDAPQSVTVKLYLQDYPDRRNTFSEVQALLPPQKGSNAFLKVKVEPKDLPDTNSVDKQYVYLVAKSDDAHFQFHKEAKILLSYRDGMVFIQTDKPIYTPRQTVRIRVIPLNFDMKPSKREITVIIMNPQKIRVEQWKNLNTNTGIIQKDFILNNFIIKGNWTITALYGYKNIHNATVQFEVKEYVLPKFSVKLTVPPYILDTDEDIEVTIKATYTYGKPVVGAANIRLKIVEANELDVPFPPIPPILLDSGTATVKEKVEVIRDLLRAFPEKGRRRLQVQAYVIERATGNKETVEDNSCLFTSSPYFVEFKNTLKYFKPGMPFVVKVVVTYPNKEPAKSVPVKISATGIKQNEKQDLKPNGKTSSEDETNAMGEAEFVVDSCADCPTIQIKVETNDKRLQDSQNALANYIVKAFDSGNGPTIKVRQYNPPGKVGEKVNCEGQRTGDEAAAVMSFVVVSRGKILLHDTTDFFRGSPSTSWSFRVSPEMSPSARLIGYYVHSNGLVVADSIELKIEDKLPTEVEFSDAFERGQSDGKRVQKNVIEIPPAEGFTLRIKAPPGTRLGLLGVDKSVYLLRNENRLTEERIFKTVEKLDLGCGVGGGKDSKGIFKNAGVVLMTDDFMSDWRNDYGCDKDGSRRKRSSELDSDYKICCEMGKENRNVSCEKLDLDSNKGLDQKCREAFWKCCKEKYATNDTSLLGRSILQNHRMTDEETIRQAQLRTYFPETWIFMEKVVGPNGYCTIPLTIPGTMTTWVMQAVAINNETGLGLAPPLRILSRKDFFVSLKMPYSVKRGEQVSLLVTAFNYVEEKLQATIYIRGGEGFCSVAADNNLELIGKVDIPANDSRSVAIPIVPKRTGEVEVEVLSVFAGQLRNIADAVKRKLFVVPEGLEQNISSSFVLDPKGVLNDDPNKPNADPSKIPVQKNTIKLIVPKKAIPGSIGAFVYLTGNLLGPVVNTTIEGGLEGFFRKPTGCGEQMMIRLAPNVYVLEYLMNTNQLSGANEENAYRFIQLGYQGELNYRRDDKSFSAWGNKREGSTWLTAFVMRVFCKAQQFAGVNIDENLVCESVKWLIENQRGDGALPEVFAVSSTRMVGGAYSEGDVAMTAFVLSALAECKCNGAASEASILLAKDYLEKQYKTLNKPYSMALTAYALALVNSKEKLNANERLKQLAIYDNVGKSRHWNAGENALNVETAGYALLTQVILKNIGYGGPIVTYLTNQRKGGVGFVSTQDTVVALQALALYSEKTAGNAVDLKVKLTFGDVGPIAVHITPENALLRKKIKVNSTSFGENLYVESRGTGAGLLQVEIRYNIPSSRGKICKFDLKTTVKETKEDNVKPFGPQQEEGVGRNERPEKKKSKKKNRKGRKKGKGCKKLKTIEEKRRCRNKGKDKVKKKVQKHQSVKSIDLKVCTRKKETGSTGMAILDIGILTGFKLDEKSHEKLKQNDNLPELDNLEVSDRSLVLYLSKIPSDRELCVDVQFKREYYVGAVQAVPINVYDYYKPDQSCSVFYGPDKFSPLKLGVCDVGSSSCRCTQDKCAQQDPSIDNINKLTKTTCKNYHYAIKGKLLMIDEHLTLLTYTVEVLQIIQEGENGLKSEKRNIGDKEYRVIELVKSAACKSPKLGENNEYLFMGRDKGDTYWLDKTSFVKLWPTDPNNADKIKLDKFARKHKC